MLDFCQVISDNNWAQFLWDTV